MSGYVRSGLIPGTDATYDFGQNTLRWRFGYFSDQLSAGYISAHSNASPALLGWTDNVGGKGVEGMSPSSAWSGYFQDSTKFHLPYWTVAPTRTANGDIGIGPNGRIYFRWGTNYNSYVTYDGNGDYSEYYKTKDKTLKIGELVSLDIKNANSVERANIENVDLLTGIISQYGSRNNDNEDGLRNEDPNYANAALVGQVPVLVSDENGSIAPGDPLTVSPTKPGVAVKALNACRIVGYALTHYPYVEGEVTWPDHTITGEKDKLKEPHVMVHISAQWYPGPTK